LESRIGSLEKKINSPLNKAVVTEIRLELSLLDKKIGELNAYFTMINKVKYISESLETISKENLLECVGMMTELIDELNRNELFHLNSQSKKVEMTYKVAYNLIKKEILINHSSLLLSAIKDDEISSSVNNNSSVSSNENDDSEDKNRETSVSTNEINENVEENDMDTKDIDNDKEKDTKDKKDTKDNKEEKKDEKKPAA